MVQVTKNGTIIIGADAPTAPSEDLKQGSFDLQPDPAGLRDLAARLRDDAALTADPALKARFLASANEADGRAEASEAAALWTTPTQA